MRLSGVFYLARLILVPLLLGAAAVAEGPAPSPASAKVPPLPTPAFAEPAAGKEFAEGKLRYDEGKIREALGIFRKMHDRLTNVEEKDAVARYVRECEGRAQFAELEKLVKQGELRRARGKLEKISGAYEGTLVGEDLARLAARVREALCLRIADFEKAPSGEDTAANTFGYVTRYVEGAAATGKVREGARALSWETMERLSNLSFPLKAGVVPDYRYLRLSIRAENAAAVVELVVFLDTEQDYNMPPVDHKAPGGWKLQTSGFLTRIKATSAWQDLQLDLRAFEANCKRTLHDVVRLRIIHLPGPGATIFVDDIRLERE